MISGFHHVGISVSDLDRSVTFYRDVFGMEQTVPSFAFAGDNYSRIMALPDPRGRMTVMIRGTLALELFEYSSPSPKRQDPDRPVADHGLTHFGVWVDDIDATVARMADAGARFHSEVLEFLGGMRAAYGRDPDGNVFELLEQKK